MVDEASCLPTIGVPGVAADSALRRGLADALRGVARILLSGPPPPTGALWHWSVRRTRLDWRGAPTMGSVARETPGVLLDLHGSEIAPHGRTWRVIDQTGNCVLQP